MRPIFDAHLDLAWNALSFDRDQRCSIEQLRADELGMSGSCRGNCTVCLPELRRAGVGFCLGTLLCRARPSDPDRSGSVHHRLASRSRGKRILREDLDYANQTIASAAAQGQLAYYRMLEQQGEIRLVEDVAGLDQVWADWSTELAGPIGVLLSMEGADPILNSDQAGWWWEQGLRTACLAHYGPSAYAMGTGSDGALSDLGRELLKRFEQLGMILDLVHTADMALVEALELFGGAVFVSHANCRSLVDHDRQLSDEQIRLITKRGGVIGVVLDAWMLSEDWMQSGKDRRGVGLEVVVNHIDHICQLVGTTAHVGIGSDLDGGFGIEQCPHDLNTIVDLQKIGPILESRGYTDNEINSIFYGNWLRFFRQALPCQ